MQPNKFPVLGDVKRKLEKFCNATKQVSCFHGCKKKKEKFSIITKQVSCSYGCNREVL